MESRVFEKYLRRSGVASRVGADFLYAAVIPACDELDELPATLDSLDTARKNVHFPGAAVVVGNHPSGADDTASRATLDLLRARHDPTLFPLYAPDLTGGVGAARKLGMDAFVAAHDAESIDKCVICSLDADTQVDAKYFAAVATGFDTHPRAGFCTVGFRHRAGETPELERAIREYEAYLRDYVGNLKAAGSPYAFQSVGSAFAVRGSMYVRSGGMKVRRAGEDFYFLQECAKCGEFFELPEILTYPSPRLSGRNPFGTGPALGKLLSGGSLNRIAPPAFAGLAELLGALETPEFAAAPEGFMRRLPPECAAFLDAERFPDSWAKILANTPRDVKAQRRAFHRWFDGLRTLRFLHALTGGGKKNGEA